MKAARISEVIKKLEMILDKDGDLSVCSVGFHSDYRATAIDINKIDEHINVQNDMYPFDDKEDDPFLMIYGGNY